MKSREELLREAAEHPEKLVEYIAALQEQLGQKAEQLAQAQALIGELKRELFGAKADKRFSRLFRVIKARVSGLVWRRRRECVSDNWRSSESLVRRL